MIAAENISYTIKHRPILDEVSVSLRPGTVTALLGPNGAGKSSLLKCLSGSVQPSTGEVRLDGVRLQNYSLLELSRRRAVLSQSTALSFPFTALELVMMGRNPHADGSTQEGVQEGAQDRARQALESVDAWSLRDRIFPTLSGGEQQRVQLARVLAQIWGQRQACLFLDEPTAALDLKHQHRVFQLIRQFSRSHGLTVCVILHDPHLARRYCDRAILMQQGQVFTAGAIAEVLAADNIERVFEIPPDWLDGWESL